MAAAPVVTPEQLRCMTARDLLEAGRSLLSPSGAYASRWAVEALKDAVVVAGDRLECAICLDQVQAGAARWKEMPCGHRFHGGCLDKWLPEHGTCPMCRHPLTPPAAQMTRADWMGRRYNLFLAAEAFLRRVDLCV